MTNYIIAAALILVAAVALFFTVKHFKGESSCCGGGGYKPKKKKLKNVIVKRTFKVEGMHCENCKNRIEETVNDVKGIAAKVDLKKSTLTVYYEVDVPDEAFLSKLQRLGYKLSETE